jgi:hypothetical protein
VILLLLGLAGALLVKMGVDFLKNNLLADAPAEMIAVEADPERYEELRQDLRKFKDQEEPGELRFSASDLNLILVSDPALADWSDRARVAIEDGIIYVEFAIPMDGGFFDGKWINGRIGLQPELRNGNLGGRIVSYESLDKSEMGQLDFPPQDGQDIFQDMLLDRDFQRMIEDTTGLDLGDIEDWLEQADDLQFEEDRLILIRE